MLVEGQIVGGAAEGIGAALLEEFVYDASGQPQSVTLADYLMPTIAEIPTIEVSLFEDAPTPLNPLGVKGAGEAGISAAGAAIAAAVDDALGRAGAVRQLPITASTRCWPSFGRRDADTPRLIGRGSGPSAASAGRRRSRSSCR